MSSGFDPVPSDRLEITSEVGAALTDFDYRVMASVLKMTHALRWPKDTLSYLVDYLSLNQPIVPVSQLSGFTQFTVKVATGVDANQSTTSTVFTDLATGGPQLEGLADGKYLLLFGGINKSATAGAFAQMGVKINTTEAVSGEDAETEATTYSSVAVAVPKTLSNGDDNSVLCRYKINAVGTAWFSSRWLIAIKYQEL